VEFYEGCLRRRRLSGNRPARPHRPRPRWITGEPVVIDARLVRASSSTKSITFWTLAA
jgi:hypothetical protein